MIQPSQCDICKERESRYKCPTCKAPYCSVVCFKQHQQIPCEPTVPTTLPLPNTAAHGSSSKRRTEEDDDDDSRLTEEQLQRLTRSEEVAKYLKDPFFRDLICTIQRDNRRETLLDDARATHQDFDELVRIMVQITTDEEPSSKYTCT